MESRSDGVVMSGAWDWALSEVTNSVVAAHWKAPFILALELGGTFGLGEAISTRPHRRHLASILASIIGFLDAGRQFGCLKGGPNVITDITRWRHRMAIRPKEFLF
jgi:hypothetical protein